jgi:hypothetical protein
MSETITILDDGQEDDGAAMVAAGLIYGPCDDPNCGPFYHIDPEHNWDDVDAFKAGTTWLVTGEEGYWSNDQGWVEHAADATIFTDAERWSLHLPLDGSWEES